MIPSITAQNSISTKDIASILANAHVIRTVAVKPQSLITAEERASIVFGGLELFLKNAMGKTVTSHFNSGGIRVMKFPARFGMWVLYVNIEEDTAILFRLFQCETFDALHFESFSACGDELFIIVGSLE